MTGAAGAVHFPCPNCGAPEMAWNAGIGKMICPYCDLQMDIPPQAPAQQAPVPQAPGQPAQADPHANAGAAPAAPPTAPEQPAPLGAHQERTLAEGFALMQQGGGQGLGVEVRTIRCETCGATVNFAGVAIASTCDFCGSDQVLEQQTNRSLIRPQSLVPFGVEQDIAKKKFSDWLAGLWFRPNDLKHKAEVGDINGVYVPYWTFDATLYSQWRAEAGYYYYVTETYTTTENGRQVQRTRQVRRTRWQNASGRRQDTYDDVLVVASRGLPKKLADKMKTFDTSRLVQYDPRYLAGWRAEEYAVKIDEAWNDGKQQMEKEQRQRCSRDVPGDTQRGLQVNNQFSGETFKHVLLPLWISSYRYKDKPFRFLVNGQTGEVTGDAPWSWIKITLFVLMLITLAAGLFYAYTTTR